MASKDVLLNVLEKFTSSYINLTPFEKILAWTRRKQNWNLKIQIHEVPMAQTQRKMLWI